MLYIVLLGIFYLNYYYLLPQYYFQDKKGRYIALIVLCGVIIIAIPVIIEWHPSPPNEIFAPDFSAHHPPPKPSGITYIIQTLFFYGIGILSGIYLRFNAKLISVEKQKTSAELSYLKAQIHPHFLFNTLNSIYALSVRENADKTAEAMLKLAGMMRYIVTEASSDWVSLHKEMDYINHYIALQKLRLDASVKLEYSVTGEIRHQKIAPILLIIFIENAFKYGINPDQESEITLKISIQDAELDFYIANKKLQQPVKEYETIGLGIKNALDRLQILYYQRHHIVITDNPSIYAIQLNIQLQ
jgi:LytS/YehU family sensor histidine kinase